MTHDTATTGTERQALLGLAALMRRVFETGDLAPLAAQLLKRAQNDPNDANALMDLSTVLELSFKPDIAMATQAQALQLQPLYHLPSAQEPAVRLLALMAPGNMSTNAPLGFLLENSDIALDMLYVGNGVPSVPELPDHDVLFVAIGESEATHALLEELQPVLANWPRPVVNPPELIMQTSRDHAYALLHDAPGIVMPPSVRVERSVLECISRCEISVDTVLPGFSFPIIVRPVDSHAGHGLARLATADEFEGYLSQTPETRFFISPFVDYSDADGLFRKFRVVLIDGRPYAGHMGISTHWMIHYLNAGMAEAAAKREEEARFMAEFEHEFARRHASAIAAINSRFRLDYLVIDCAETAQGELLIFEVDTGAVVHAIDPPDIFPYKVPAMQKVFNGFRQLLVDTIAGKRRQPPQLSM